MVSSRAPDTRSKTSSSTPGARPPRITVIADGDNALDLDTIATLSRSASALLDGLDRVGRRYVLEVSSPGVDRPLTTEKHFRRARGRKVELTLSDGSQLTGRLGETQRRCGRAGGAATGRGLDGARDPARRDRQSCCPGGVFAPNPARAGTGDVGQAAGRRPEHEHRHGRAACDRGRPGHLGQRVARDHQVRAADRLPAHRRPPDRRAHRDRPQDRCRPGDGPRDRRRRQRHQRMGRHSRGLRPHRRHHRASGHAAAVPRRRERAHLRRVLHPRGRDRRGRDPARQPGQRPRSGRGPDGQRDQGLRGRHPGRRTGPRRKLRARRPAALLCRRRDPRRPRAADHAVAHPPQPGAQAVLAGGPRDRRRVGRDRGGGPRGRPPLQDRGARRAFRASTPRAPASARWGSGCAT